MNNQPKKNNSEEEMIPENDFETTPEEQTADQVSPEEVQTGPAVTSDPEDVEAVEPETETKKPNRIFRRILIWLVVIAIAFAGGFFVDTYLRYLPTVEKLTARTTELGDALSEVEAQQDEIQRLSAFEEQNQLLREENDSLTTHITILSARSAVADARLAVSQDNTAEAKLALDKVGSTLEDLEAMLNADQVEIVQNMQQRHQLIMEELERDSFSALSDLEVLSSKLGTLENTLFASP